MKVTCLHTPESSKGQYAIVYDMERWPERTLKHRGWLVAARMVFIRPATVDEVQELEGAMRYAAFRYDDWQQVMNDEAKYGIDAEVCKRLGYVNDLSQVMLHQITAG